MGSFQYSLDTLHLGELNYILTSGHPPVYLQLLAANVIVFVIWLMRRIRRTSSQPVGGGHIFALLLLMANVGIVMHGQMGA